MWTESKCIDSWSHAFTIHCIKCSIWNCQHNRSQFVQLQTNLQCWLIPGPIMGHTVLSTKLSKSNHFKPFNQAYFISNVSKSTFDPNNNRCTCEAIIELDRLICQTRTRLNSHKLKKHARHIRTACTFLIQIVAWKRLQPKIERKMNSNQIEAFQVRLLWFWDENREWNAIGCGGEKRQGTHWLFRIL